jgi:hypothetical protein
MLRFLAVPACLLTTLVAVAQPPQPAAPQPGEVEKLVAQLGSEDFQEREAATRRLEAIGTAAVDALRAAIKSENPETARRANDLLRKAERTLANERTLAPTLVELDAKDRPLDDILADLSKQAKCEVVLGGLKPEELAGKKVTVATDGKVPFWSAVLQVCDAADLQVASVGGFVAPGAMPYLGRPKSGLRVATRPQQAVVLESRGDAKRRPAAVYGAVLVEAVPFAKGSGPESPAVLLQAWPEPRLQWERMAELKVTKALTADGTRLVAEPTPVLPGNVIRRTEDGVIFVRNPDGSVTAVRDTGGAFQLPGGFRPNPRQVAARFKPPEKPAESVKELGVSLFANVRTGIEPLAVAGGLERNKPAAGTGIADVGLSITYRKEPDGKLMASVEVSYDARGLFPVGVGDELPGARPGTGIGVGNYTVNGVRVSDAEGKPYTLGLSSGSSQFDPTGRRVVHKMQLELHPDKEGHGPPASIAFWGTYSRQVEMPLNFKDVPLGK